MKITTQRILFSFSGIVILICAVVVYSLLIQPAYTTIMDLRGQLAAKTDAVSSYQATIAQVNALSSNLGDVSAQQQRAAMIMPLGPDSPYFSNQIIGVARQSGLTVDAISIRQATQPIATAQSSAIKRIGNLEATVQVTGGYSQIKSFLQAIQNNTLLMNISSVAISVASPGSTMGNVKVASSMLTGTISIVSYYQETDQEAQASNLSN
jgi:Tfp pilus assembly protein PilO